MLAVRIANSSVGVLAVGFHLLVGRGRWVDGRVNALSITLAVVWCLPFALYLVTARGRLQSTDVAFGGLLVTVGLLQYVYRVDSSTAALGFIGLPALQYSAFGILATMTRERSPLRR